MWLAYTIIISAVIYYFIMPSAEKTVELKQKLTKKDDEGPE